LDKKVLERRLAELERESDAAKKRKLELDRELSKQEILYKQLVDNNDALLKRKFYSLKGFLVYSYCI
jgi:hypothetical protein